MQSQCRHECSVATLLAVVCRFVLSHPLVASTVIGAMSVEQLTAQLDIAEQPPLPEDLLAAIELVHQQYPNPCP